jgi:hypothetical protein
MAAFQVRHGTTPYFGVKEASLKERKENPGEAPAPLNPRHRPSTEAHKREILQAPAAWPGGSLAFCKEYRVNPGTLIIREKATMEQAVPPVQRKRTSHEQRRPAAEAFFKVGFHIRAL